MPSTQTSSVILITGASRGIGAATAMLAAKRGYRVGVNCRSDREGAERVAGAIQAAGGQAIAVAADVSQEQDVARMFETTAELLGPVTALVNNAAVLEQQCRMDEIDRARFERILAINVIGTFLCCKEAVRRMSTRYGGTGGSIVNVSSIAARTGSPFEYVDYAASKGAVDTLTIGLAKEVANEGIRVNGVRPGLIHTGMHASGGEPGRVERLKSKIPMQRGGEPEEVAAAIVWLLSEEASFVTGSLLDIGGGI